jgi:predicted ester cyclase
VPTGEHEEAREGFPDLTIAVEEVMAEGDSSRDHARHPQRRIPGHRPTGKRVEVRAMDMFRIEDGKIVEHWGTPTIQPASYERPSARKPCENAPFFSAIG